MGWYREKNRKQFGFGAYAEVERWWTNGGRKQIEALTLSCDTA